MKLLVRAVLAQMLIITLLFPVNVETVSPPPAPRMEDGRGGPPAPGGMAPDRAMRPPGNPSAPETPGNDPQMIPSNDKMGPPGNPSAPKMSGNDPQRMSNNDRMEGHLNMPHEGTHHGPEAPTHVVSGVDTDFKEQESIDHAVDTINAKSGGNWLLKRVWWEKTEEVYEQIKEEFNKVMDTRMRFISEYNKLNRSLDIFYSEIGIEQGPLRDLLSHAQDLMDKEHKEQGYLNKREQAFVFKLKGKERDLEQLKLDVKAIQELDAKLDEAFEMLFKQIDVCNQYEQKAWDNFKEIARELNDKEARKLYYDTEGLHKDVQKVSDYISGAFSTYFNQTIQSAHDHTSKISSQMNVLKNEGIDLVKQAEILEKDEVPTAKKVVKESKAKQKKGWWYSLGQKIGKFVDMLVSYLPKSVRVWFVKETKEVDAEYEKLKREGDQEYDKLQKEVDADVAPLEKEVDQVGEKTSPDIKLVQQEAKKIEDSVFGKPTEAQKKVLGIDDASKHKPSHLTPVPKTVLPQPALSHATLPHPPAVDMHSGQTPMRPMKEHAVEHMPHRPAHASSSRRNITDHFNSSVPSHTAPSHLRTSKSVMHGRSPEGSHELHNMKRDVHPDVMHHESPRPAHESHSEHHSSKVNAFNPGTLR